MSTTFTSISNDVNRQVGVVETITGATTLSAEDSSKVLILKGFFYIRPLSTKM